MITLHTVDDSTVQSLPFLLPARKFGNYSIEHEVAKAGTKETIVSLRNAIFMGLSPCSIVLERDTVFHSLTYKHGTWMSSHLQEIEQHERQLSGAYGHVIVGGLGLGLAVALLAKNKRVKSMVVVEKSKAVIRLVQPHLPRTKPVRIIHDDLFHYLKLSRERGYTYDFAFYDIWQPTGERIITAFTLPLRIASIGLVDQTNIEQWNEDEMIGQVRLGLVTAAAMRLDYILKMDERAFRRYARTNAVGPLWNCVRQTECYSEDMGERYVRALKDAELFQKEWSNYVVR